MRDGLATVGSAHHGLTMHPEVIAATAGGSTAASLKGNPTFQYGISRYAKKILDDGLAARYERLNSILNNLRNHKT
jgi:hypothetical protein